MRAICFFTFSLNSSIIEWRLSEENSDGAAIYNPAIAVHVDAFLCGPQAVFCSQSRKLWPRLLVAINERVPLSFEFNTTERARSAHRTNHPPGSDYNFF